MQRSLFYLPLLASLCLTFLSSFSPAHANGCDLSNPLDGVAGGSLCIAVETITENPGTALVVVLHGDMSSGKPPSYATRFARRITETNPDVTIISMFRPGYNNGNSKKSQGNTNGRRDHRTAANIDAVAKAVQNLAVQHNASRTIVVAHSGGAATAALIAGRHPDILDGMVLISCPCDITRWRRERNGSDWPASLSPNNYIDQIDPKIQITAVTGRNDTNTRPGLAKTYIANIRERGGNAKFLEISGERHFLSTKLAHQTLPLI